MKFYHWAAGAACIAFMATSCHEAPIGEDFADINYKAQGALATTSNVQVGFFDLADPDNAGVAFDVDVKGEAASEVEVTATHSSGATAVFANVSSVPATLNVPLDELLVTLGLTLEDVAVGDEVVFSFRSAAASGTFTSSETLAIPFSCSSALAGKMDYVSTNYFCGGDDLTGEVELTEDAAGKYLFDDWAFGAYHECYGGPASSWGGLQLEDVCNTISVGGEDSYGDSWEFTINSIDGAVMNANWVNTYGEFGTVTLTRQDGADWPPLVN
jgi:hypothetical protein